MKSTWFDHMKRIVCMGIISVIAGLALGSTGLLRLGGSVAGEGRA